MVASPRILPGRRAALCNNCDLLQEGVSRQMLNTGFVLSCLQCRSTAVLYATLEHMAGAEGLLGTRLGVIFGGSMLHSVNGCEHEAGLREFPPISSRGTHSQLNCNPEPNLRHEQECSG